jgi:hypothetical protein
MLKEVVTYERFAHGRHLSARLTGGVNMSAFVEALAAGSGSRLLDLRSVEVTYSTRVLPRRQEHAAYWAEGADPLVRQGAALVQALGPCTDERPLQGILELLVAGRPRCRLSGLALMDALAECLRCSYGARGISGALRRVPEAARALVGLMEREPLRVAGRLPTLLAALRHENANRRAFREALNAALAEEGVVGALAQAMVRRKDEDGEDLLGPALQALRALQLGAVGQGLGVGLELEWGRLLRLVDVACCAHSALDMRRVRALDALAHVLVRQDGRTQARLARYRGRALVNAAVGCIGRGQIRAWEALTFGKQPFPLARLLGWLCAVDPAPVRAALEEAVAAPAPRLRLAKLLLLLSMAEQQELKEGAHLNAAELWSNRERLGLVEGLTLEGEGAVKGSHMVLGMALKTALQHHSLGDELKAALTATPNRGDLVCLALLPATEDTVAEHLQLVMSVFCRGYQDLVTVLLDCVKRGGES